MEALKPCGPDFFWQQIIRVMIADVNDILAAISKAYSDEQTTRGLNGLTRLNNEIVLTEVREILNDEGGEAYDD